MVAKWESESRPFPVSDEAAARFWTKVDRKGDEDCWTWIAAVGGDGYGSWRYQYIGWRAHRVAYELVVGPIPQGLSIDHLCRNRLCVNPAHLEPVTLAENTRRQSLRRSTCKRGHPRIPENYYPRPDGDGGQCVPCIRLRTRQATERRRAQRAA